MLSAVFLLTIIIGCSFQSVAKKQFGRKNGSKGVFFFSALTSLSAAIFFVISTDSLTFDKAILPYSLFFGIAYATATVCDVIAVTCGPLSLTTLIISYSLMLPTLYGLIFLREPISFGLIPGLVLLVISLFLIRAKGGSVTITPKWIISVLLAFVGNGFCSIAQNMEQVQLAGAYKNEFMICALLFVSVTLFLFSLGGERHDIVPCFKNGWYWAVLCGAFNGVVNLFVMLLMGRMPSSIMFPLISAGQIVFTFLVAIIIYKERLSRSQIAGLVFGILAVVFLNI